MNFHSLANTRKYSIKPTRYNHLNIVLGYDRLLRGNKMDLDQKRGSYTLLRYLLIISTVSMKKLFITKEIHESLKNIVWDFLHPDGKKHPDLKHIDTHIEANYLRIDFQSSIGFDLVSFVRNFKSTTSRNLLNLYPELRVGDKGLWNNSYLLATQGDLSQSETVKYLTDQYSREKIISATDRLRHFTSQNKLNSKSNPN